MFNSKMATSREASQIGDDDDNAAAYYDIRKIYPAEKSLKNCINIE